MPSSMTASAAQPKGFWLLGYVPVTFVQGILGLFRLKNQNTSYESNLLPAVLEASIFLLGGLWNKILIGSPLL